MTRSKWTGAVMALSFLIGGTLPALAQNSFPTAGPVGVGTSSPTFMLDVFGTNSVPLRLTGRGGSASNSSQMRFAGQKDGELFAIGADLMGAGARDFSVFDLVANTMRFMINPSGNVGIGTSAPAYRLDVKGMSTVAARFTGTAQGMNSTQPHGNRIGMAAGQGLVILCQRGRPVAALLGKSRGGVGGVAERHPGLLLGDTRLALCSQRQNQPDRQRQKDGRHC